MAPKKVMKGAAMKAKAKAKAKVMKASPMKSKAMKAKAMKAKAVSKKPMKASAMRVMKTAAMKGKALRTKTMKVAATKAAGGNKKKAIKPDIVVVGSSNMDLVAYTPRFPGAGETIMGSVFETGFGGKGANQAVLIGKLGAKVAMVTQVGTDSFGKDTIANYDACNVDTTHVKTAADGVMTGVAPISVDATGENTIIVCPGANMCMKPEDVDAAQDMIRGARIIVCQNEVPLDVTAQALKLGKENGVCTLWSIAPCPPEAKDYPAEMFKNVDVLMVNESEAEMLGGTPGLLSKGVATCIITLGSKGCKIVTEGGEQHVPGEQVEKVVDTTGAGDAFAGAFAFFKAKGLDNESCCKLANKVGAISVQAKGTQKSYPLGKDVRDIIG